MSTLQKNGVFGLPCKHTGDYVPLTKIQRNTYKIQDYVHQLQYRNEQEDSVQIFCLVYHILKVCFRKQRFLNVWGIFMYMFIKSTIMQLFICLHVNHR